VVNERNQASGCPTGPAGSRCPRPAVAPARRSTRARARRGAAQRPGEQARTGRAIDATCARLGVRTRSGVGCNEPHLGQTGFAGGTHPHKTRQAPPYPDGERATRVLTAWPREVPATPSACAAMHVAAERSGPAPSACPSSTRFKDRAAAGAMRTRKQKLVPFKDRSLPAAARAVRGSPRRRAGGVAGKSAPAGSARTRALPTSEKCHISLPHIIAHCIVAVLQIGPLVWPAVHCAIQPSDAAHGRVDLHFFSPFSHPLRAQPSTPAKKSG
jgi:hypothetical protein